MSDKKYSILALVFPSIHDDNQKINAVLDKSTNLIYDIHNDYPDDIIYIYTPNVSIFKHLMDNAPFVQVKFIETTDIVNEEVIQSIHIWANESDEVEQRTVEVIQEKFNSLDIYNIATFI